MGAYRFGRFKYIVLACGLAFGLLLVILTGLSHPRRALAGAQEGVFPNSLPNFSLGIKYVVTNTNGVGAGSLRRAIHDANANPGADAVIFDIPGCSPKFPCVISLAAQLPLITDTLTISGTSATSLIIDANHTTRGLSIDSVPVTITDLTIQNGFTTDNGGGIYTTDTLALLRVRLLNNLAGHLGGGVYAANGLMVREGYLENNTAYLSGGGLYSGDWLSLSDTELVSNTASDNGGGLYAIAPITITNSTFVSNTVHLSGGGLYANSRLSIDKGWFENNHGTSGGGLLAFGSMAISRTVFINNTAASGGALDVRDQWTVNASTFVANLAVYGGGISDYQGSGLAVNTLFSKNVALSGSALYLAESNTTILHSTLVGELGSGSGIYVSPIGGTTLALLNSILAHHDVGINNGGGTVIQNYNLFFDNTMDVLGSYTGGTNNVTGDPYFLDPDAGDYRLTRGSAAIDAGFDSGIPVDFEDEARPLGSGADIGFDEANLIAGLTVTYTPNPAVTVQSPVTFTASTSAGGTVSYTWDFGDGSPLQTGNPLNHTYLSAGTYPVTVTAASTIDSLTAAVALKVGSILYFPLVVR